MKNLIKMGALAMLVSPLVSIAADGPYNLGDVTVFGNIAAKSPLWQWTVNDYSGTRLNAKGDEAVTVNGITAYKLNGQKFIAVSAFLPSLTASKSFSSPATVRGLSDRADFMDDKGTPIGDVKDKGQGMVSFSVTAYGKDKSGHDVLGKLMLEATELRGTKRVYASRADGLVNKQIVLFGGSFSEGDSCFAGQGSYSSREAVISGTSENPVKGVQSVSAFNAFISGLDAADAAGNAPKFSSFTATGTDTATRATFDCNTGSVISSDHSANFLYPYTAAAHIVELEPMELNFPSPVIGNWHATLNVTAYQI